MRALPQKAAGNNDKCVRFEMFGVRSSGRWRGAMSSRMKDGLGLRLNPWGLASREHEDDTYTESLCPYFMDLG